MQHLLQLLGHERGYYYYYYYYYYYLLLLLQHLLHLLGHERGARREGGEGHAEEVAIAAGEGQPRHGHEGRCGGGAVGRDRQHARRQSRAREELQRPWLGFGLGLLG